MARHFCQPCLVSILVIIGLLCVQVPVSAGGGLHLPPDLPPLPNSDPDGLKTFIVYLGEKPKSALLAIQFYKRIVHEILGKNGSDAILHTYTKSFSGFSVRMTEHHKNLMSKFNGIVSIFESQTRQIQTTRSWDFVGFPLTFNHSTTESDVIIGILDSGIWPESGSFSDVGFGPPPAKWKGSCPPTVDNFICNNKIVGAKYYKADGIFDALNVASPRDTAGHGTHVASTAAGGVVPGASMLGIGLGAARGGVPAARISVYKVCWSNGCRDEDILAAFDDAIDDGLDILSLSLGGSVAKDYFQDALAIGCYHAMKNGILPSIAAGNDGPEYFTTTNVAPWSLGVAATTTDRTFLTSVQLGNNIIYQGTALNTFDTLPDLHPLIYGEDAPNIIGGYTSISSRLCIDNSLNPDLVRDKIVLCASRGQGQAGFVAGAAGALYADNGPKDASVASALPASLLEVQTGNDILVYMSTSPNPTATIFKTADAIDTTATAPNVGSFSSRGPSRVTPDILKPDISAPGVNILAAWPTVAPVTSVAEDTRSVTYNIISGTSMACPHASGVAALIKSFNPTWSPAAIKSAMMTTATPMNPVANRQLEYGYGSGNINPIKALNPGLIYDAGNTDYLNFLCAAGYSASQIQLITNEDFLCPALPGSIHDLNYPSFALNVITATPVTIPLTSYRRTVTNVGAPSSIYKATVNAPGGLNVQVVPDSLTFSSVGQSLSYTLTISGVINNVDGIASASLVWDNGVNQVRSPVIVAYVYVS